MSLSQFLINLVRTAGAYRESDTERDGFLSYAAETHSVGYGLAVGAAIALNLAGVPWVLELVFVALGGVGAKRRFGNERVMREITDEPQYFLGALVLGFVVVGLVAVFLGGATLPF